MLKNFRNIIIGIILISSWKSLALNSSSYLIANEAIKLLDFEVAYNHFKNTTNLKTETNLHNQLLTYVHLKKILDAHAVAEEILKINKKNEEAWIVILTYAKINNNMNEFKRYQEEKNETEMALLNYIFYEDKNKIKNNMVSARSIMEVVQGTISDSKESANYNFLLFYLSLSTMLDPNYNEGYYISAQIYEKLKKLNKAKDLYEQVSNMHSLYLDSQINIALIKNNQGLFNEGEKILQELLDKFAQNEKIIIALADLNRLAKKYKRAIDYYSNVLSSQNNSIRDYSRVFYMRGICYERIKNWKSAEKDFFNSLELNPESADVLNYLAYGWLERDENLDIAINMLKKAYNKNPDSHHILDSLAWAYYKNNQLTKASNLMEKVIVMAPGEAISLDHLGDIYFAMKRKREANFFWKQALDLADPKNKIKKNLLKKLNL